MLAHFSIRVAIDVLAVQAGYFNCFGFWIRPYFDVFAVQVMIALMAELPSKLPFELDIVFHGQFSRQKHISIGPVVSACL